MSRRKAQVRQRKANQSGESQGELPPTRGSAHPQPRLNPWREWLVRIALVLLGPVTVVLLAEGVLGLLGFGYPTSFFVRAGTGGEYVTNEKFAWQFFSRRTDLKPFLFTMAAHKPAGAIRICVLGESAAMGTPDPAFGFGRILEYILRRQYPGKHIEVINAAMRGINSHIVRVIARECVAYEVDAFILYMGNNEVIGLYAPGPKSPGWAQSLLLIRASQWFRATKLGQLYELVLSRPAKESGTQDMPFFREHRLRADDWRRTRNTENFRANLEDICRTITRAGSKVILCTVGANLKDFPPLGSLHRADLTAADETRWEEACQSGSQLEAKGELQGAFEHYLAAAHIDDHYAELHFRLARCSWALGDAAQAKRGFTLARDWDALQFRADGRANEIIRNVGAALQSQGVTLVDMETRFTESELSEGGIPGKNLFHDHVHPTFAGNYLLARSCGNGLRSALEGTLGTPAATDLPSQRECAEAIAYTAYDELNVLAAMVRLTAGPPFLDQLEHARRQSVAESENEKRLAAFNPADAQRCLNAYQNAISREPDYWPLRFNLGSLYEELGRQAEAAKQFQYLVDKFPQAKPFRIALGNSLLKAGDTNRARLQFLKARELDSGPSTRSSAD